MNTWLPIQYRGFWDVPRVFLVRHEGVLFLFVSPFLEEVDDYTDSYRVYVLPETLLDDALPSDWTTLIPRASRYLGDIPIQEITFDATRRKQIAADALENLLRNKSRTTA